MRFTRDFFLSTQVAIIDLESSNPKRKKNVRANATQIWCTHYSSHGNFFPAIEKRKKTIIKISNPPPTAV